MFGLSFGELVIVAILALVLLGPDRLPEAAKTIGRTLKDFKKATDGLKDQIETELYSAEKSIEKYVNAPDVPPVAASMASATRHQLPAPPATAQNVPGLEAALVDPAPAPPAPEPPGETAKPA